jgi:sarcosine oxidase subunit gamma
MAEVAARETPTPARSEWLRPLPPAARFVLHAPAAARALAAPVWSPGFSELACRASGDGDRASLWLGPDEYLLLAPDAEGAALHASLATALAGSPHALVDVSHRQTAFEIIGPHAPDILNGGCPLDLDLAEFPVGMCTRTVFAKAEITLWRTASQTFHVEVWRSFTDYLTQLLAEVARDYTGRA